MKKMLFENDSMCIHIIWQSSFITNNAWRNSQNGQVTHGVNTKILHSPTDNSLCTLITEKDTI